MSGIVIGYGFTGDKAALIEAGAHEHHIYIEAKGSTEKREEITSPRGARKGDRLIVLYMKRLGATEVAREEPIAILEERGVVIVEVRPAKTPKTRGAKPALDRTAEEEDFIRKVWLTRGRSVPSRLDEIYRETRLRFTRNMLNGRHGTPKTPKPKPSPPEPARKRKPKKRKKK